jgi:hypothetical protein
MKRLDYLLSAGLLLAALLLPFRAVALAGLAEHYLTYQFNRYAQLVWVNPGDVCEGSDKYCLDLVKEDRRGFAGIDGSLEAINVPSDPTSPYIIARRSADDRWFVYDLGEEAFLMGTGTLEQALGVWADRGLADPVFIESHNPDQYLEETPESFRTRWGWQLVFMAMGLVVPCLLALVAFGLLARAFRRGYRKSGSRYKLVLARVFMVPTVLAGIVLLLSVGLLIAIRVFGS